eukprot:Blabericola_migrator_1__10064@NODE_558_length_7604_cov_14_461059_g418_i0_p4_GENE_NODE_558_length_7604_cov_14_461059_g418_i0NODE_558_length_7604_cov_14_461059_g418_i0_p4_ORF_typecomplete_len156_score1_22Ribosomal_L26/PF16906_5/0_11_NODE_558_length_7604_cov_14_461059_g418_i061356602
MILCFPSRLGDTLACVPNSTYLLYPPWDSEHTCAALKHPGPDFLKVMMDQVHSVQGVRLISVAVLLHAVRKGFFNGCALYEFPQEARKGRFPRVRDESSTIWSSTTSKTFRRDYGRRSFYVRRKWVRSCSSQAVEYKVGNDLKVSIDDITKAALR